MTMTVRRDLRDNPHLRDTEQPAKRPGLALAVAGAFAALLVVVGVLLAVQADRVSPVEQEIRQQIEQTSSYGLFCADVALYGGIEKYLSGEGGSGTPFAEADWPAFRAIHAAEC